jgi:hypothetical protein
MQNSMLALSKPLFLTPEKPNRERIFSPDREKREK